MTGKTAGQPKHGCLTLKPTGVRVPHVHPASPDVPHPKGKDLGADIWALIHEGVVRGG